MSGTSLPRSTTPDLTTPHHTITHRLTALLAVVGLAAGSVAFTQLPQAATTGQPTPERGQQPADISSETKSGEPASQAAGYDPASGKSLKVYPPHPIVDYKHMRLELTIPDMEIPRAGGVQTLTFAPVAPGTTSLTLDAKAFTVSSVSSPGNDVSFTHNGRKLNVTFAQPLEAGKDVTLITNYQLNDPPLGLTWTPSSPAWPQRAAQLHTQGQPETNSYWFPCHDYPNERLTTEIIVLAPAAYEVCSNGRLVNVSNAARPNEGGPENQLTAYRRWHWLQEQPHVNYLVTLVVGRFDIVDVGTGTLPMPVYVPPGRGPDVKVTYGRTAQMVDFFSRRLSEPYPFDKYAQLVVWNFGAGGMENTSATTMFDTAIIGAANIEDHDLDGLISHELGHQWFGDLITCNSWEHIWLNEGFATYLTSLWFEERDGSEGYQRNIRNNFDSVLTNDVGEAPATVGMVSKVYTHPWETFRRGANPYSKGASILHMLRKRLGDEAFFRGVAAYVDEHKFSTVETADLRRALEAASGDSLEQFFAQWCLRPGVPSLTITDTFDASTNQLTFTVEQTQPINGDNPAFELTLPITYFDGQQRNVTIPITGQTTTVSFPCAADPAYIAIDPDQHVLARITTTQPAARSLAQATSLDLPLAARIAGLRQLELAEQPLEASALNTLSSLARNPATPVWTRIETVKALAGTKSWSDLRAVASVFHNSWEVREAVAIQLPKVVAASPASLTSIADLLDHTFSTDPSLKVRCAALRGLATIKAPQTLRRIQAALLEESQHDSLRSAALDAAGMLSSDETIDQEKLLDLVLVHLKEGFDPRTQAAAAKAAAALAKANPEKAIAALAQLLEAGENRAQRGAGEALVAIGDPRAIPVIESVLAKTRAEETAWQSGQWLRSLRNKK
jgi:aminopeptidase N